jgi:hypothetical protein
MFLGTDKKIATAQEAFFSQERLRHGTFRLQMQCPLRETLLKINSEK